MPDDLLSLALAPQFEYVRVCMGNLAASPPPSIMLEGGNEAARLELALYWAALLNCRKGEKTPCLNCPTCRQMAANQNPDLFIYDGRISNRQDEEKPGPIRALNIDNIRKLKARTAVRPHGTKMVAIIQGMTQTREEALNSLLKVLEEPGENTVFVLLAPQRAQVLPTLVSRSLCLTLPWQDSNIINPDVSELVDALALFFSNGCGFLEKISVKGAIDATIAGSLLVACQGALARSIRSAQKQLSSLDSHFARLGDNPNSLAQASAWLAEAQDMLADAVNPARVLESVATRLYLLLHGKA